MIKPDMNLVEMSNCIVPQCRSGELGRNSVFRPALQLRANPKILMISNEREREREREREHGSMITNSEAVTTSTK